MIVVVGDIAVDIISTLQRPLQRGSDAPARIDISPGGSGANVAVWLARCGHPVTFVGRVGDDLFGRWLASDLIAEGVAPHLVTDPNLPTGVIQVLVEPDGERTMVPDRGANAGWGSDDVPEELIASADILHLVGYVLLNNEGRPGALQALRYARNHGIFISVDPSSHGPLGEMGVERFASLVGGIDILLPNREEARVLSGRVDPLAALRFLQAYAHTVAIKLDRDGCIAASESELWQIPSRPIALLNSTGAGDAFNAGFLAKWVESRDLEAACRAGTALGEQAASLATAR